MTWSVGALCLSTRLAPFPTSSGRVRAWLCKPLDRFWAGSDHEPLILASDDEPRDDDDDDHDERDNEDDDEASKQDPQQQHFDELTAAMEGLWPGVDTSDSSSSSSDSSSSSSSNGSSTTSNRSSKSANKAKVEPMSKDDKVPVAKRVAEEVEHPHVKRSRVNTVQFGAHQLVHRYTKGVLTGYQLSCRCAGHVSCSKELAVAVAGSDENARRILKSWSLLGHGMTSRDEHMAPELKSLFLQSLRNNELLSEEALDKLASATLDDMPAPFAPAPLEAPSKIGRNILGNRSTDTPAEVHARMIEMASRGEIPITSLQQRVRNKRTSGSSYGVPEGLADAIRHGYISPNLAPPKGLVWRHRGGSWVLAPRGG